ncbi:MAG TPA: trypsin-like peptidase domain-containing protein [Gemmatimonadales bacterium]|jgi:S1-C subfamily serine protease
MTTPHGSETGAATGPLQPAIVYLTGRRAGTTVWPAGDYLRIGTIAGAEIPLTVGVGEVPPEEYGIIRRVGQEFELDPAPGKEVLVNGDPADQRLLSAGDVIEVGRGGPMLRVRFYPASASGKPLRDAMGDCVECARRSRSGRWRRWAAVARYLPAELLTQTARSVRLAVLGVMALGLGTGGLLVFRTVQLERQLAEERGRVAGLSELLERAREYPTSAADLARTLDDMQTDASETARRVRALEGQSAASRLVIAAATRSTVFIQGAWGFVDPQTGAPLRVVVGPTGAPIRGPGGEPLVTTDEAAPVLEALFTGTGFVVREDGLLLSNRHIARPWDFDDAARRVAQQGWVPVMRRMIAYVPGAPDSLPLQLVGVSDSVDLALFRGTGAVRGLTVLPLAEYAAQAGEEVIVLGYPLGMRALMARADAQFLADLRAGDDVDFWTLGARLARTGQVAPLASRGIVSQVTREAVVYDAETTSGGSGGPVLSMRGEVLAVTSAILPEFGGSNLGVPVARARGLLERVGR